MQALDLYDKFDFLVGKYGDNNLQVTDIVHDSRKAGSNKIFLAREGFNTDGHKYIDDAYENGSRVFILKEYPAEMREDALYFKTEKPADILGLVSAEIFGHPEEKMDLIGITGTNGKTTTTYMIKSFLEHLGIKTGLLGTIEIYDGDKTVDAQRTTPEANDIFRNLARMYDNGCEKVVMEVSSHALSLGRIQGLTFSAVAFTNISRDHLDFHDDFNDYLNSKLRLLDYLKPEGKVYYNNDDSRLKAAFEGLDDYNTFTYSIKNDSDYKVESINLYQDKIEFTLKNKEFNLKMSGKFNVYNCLAASAILLESGIDTDKIIEAVNNFSGVPGRFEYVSNETDIVVLVDYAHTPAGIKNVLNSINEFKERNVIAVFGCGGDRDKDKRPEMGIIGYELADKIILTSDNPRSEEPAEIIKDIEAGINNKYPEAKYDKIIDRGKAIKKAILEAETDDIIIIFGKGHETYQEFADKVIDFDDREVASQALKQRGGGK